MPGSIIETLPLTDWNGPYEARRESAHVAALESRQRCCSFRACPSGWAENEKQFLDARVSDGKAKNISRDPDTGKIQSTSLDRRCGAAGLTAMIARFADQASSPGAGPAALPHCRARPHQLPPGGSEGPQLFQNLRRPAAACRCLSFASHAGAGASCASSPMSHPPHPGTGWSVNPSRRLPATSFRGSDPHLPGQSWLYEKLGVTRGRRSLYDELMLSLHDAGKLDDAFQQTIPRDRGWISPPAAAGWSSPTRCCMRRWAGNSHWNRPSTWMWTEMAEPARAPIRVLERLAGRAPWPEGRRPPRRQALARIWV